MLSFMWGPTVWRVICSKSIQDVSLANGLDPVQPAEGLTRGSASELRSDCGSIGSFFGAWNNSLLSPWQAPEIAPLFLNVLLSGPFYAWSWPGKHGAACLWTHPHPHIYSARISCFLPFLPVCSLTQFSCLFWFCTVQRSGSLARRWQGRKLLVIYWDILLKCLINYSSFQKHV